MDGFPRACVYLRCAAPDPGVQGTILLASQVDSSLSKASPRSSPAPSPKKNALAHEVRVLATGARPSGNSGQRELFSEETTSVLVFENGGVIRLSAAVVPGQLLFLTNLESKREVVAQVTHKRTNRPTTCYVELEFTESAPGFWGVEIPKAPQREHSPQHQKHLETAELVHSSEMTADEPRTPVPSPSTQEVQELKKELETLRKQLESLRETQTATPHPASPIAPHVPGTVEPAVRDAESPKADVSLPASPKPSKSPQESAPPAAMEFPEEKKKEVPAATTSPTKPPKATIPAGLKDAQTKPTGISSALPDSDEDLLPKPALDFDKAAAKAKRSRSKGDGAAHGSQTRRRSFLLVALLFVIIGAAWTMNWLPWLPPMRKATPSVTAVAAKTITAHPAPAGTKPPAGARTLPPVPPLSESVKDRAALESSPKLEPITADSRSSEGTSSLVEKTSPAASRPKQILLRSAGKSADVWDTDSADATGIMAPKLVHSVRPVAPPEAMRQFVTGNVTVDAAVDSNGHVKSAKALSGPETLRKTAVDTVKQYRYKPATQNGKPVPAHVQVTLQFWYEP